MKYIDTCASKDISYTSRKLNRSYIDVCIISSKTHITFVNIDLRIMNIERASQELNGLKLENYGIMMLAV